MMRIFILLMGLALASCGLKSQTENAAPVMATGVGIIGGTSVEEGSALASGIVAVYDEENDAICTGSLIAEDIVLTAAHCVYQLRAERLKIVFGTNVMMLLRTHEPDAMREYSRPVTQFKIHAKYNPDTHEDQPFDWADIAVLKFKGGLLEGYKPVKMVPDMKLIQPGINVTMAGYGVNEVTVFPVNPKKLKDLKEMIAHGIVFCEDGHTDCVQVDMSGDGYLRETQSPIAFVIRSEVRLDESHGKATCSGDSGGPVYLEQNGEKFLFGITSRGSGLCDGVGIYTNAVYYRDWIADVISGFKK